MMNFNNFTDATTNGTQLSPLQTAVAQVSTAAAPATTQIAGNAMTDVAVQAPQVAPMPGAQQGNGFFSPQGGAGLVLGGIQVLGNLWSSFQAHKMAKEQMSFAREQWDTNLENQTQSYNTSLEDRIRGRYAMGTRSDKQLQNEIDKHSL